MRKEGWRFFPNHVLPPLFLNALIGFTLFFTYSTTSTYLAPTLPPHSPLVAFIAGSVAGAAQSLISAPLDNARLLLLRRQRLLRQYTRSSHSRLDRHHGLAATKPFTGWLSLLRTAVFHSPSTSLLPSTLPDTALTPEARRKLALNRARNWARRGWSLWGLSLSKDAVAFGVFFTLFEQGRKVARGVGLRYDGLNESDYLVADTEEDDFAYAATKPHRSKASLALQATLLLVAGAVAGWSFSLVARPFERIRGAIWEGRARWAELDGRLKVAEERGMASGSEAEVLRRRKRATRKRPAATRGLARRAVVHRRREGRRLGRVSATKRESRAGVRRALELLPTKTRQPLPSAFALVRLAARRHGALTYLFAPRSALVTQQPTRAHTSPPRRPIFGPTRLSSRRTPPVSAKDPVWKRGGRVLQYVPPYAIGLLVYALFSGDLA